VNQKAKGIVRAAARKLQHDGVKGFRPAHPLGLSITKAKAVLAEVLSKAENLEMLRDALQLKFNEDPVGFFLTFEPMLRRFEDYGDIPGVHRPIRILIETPDNHL